MKILTTISFILFVQFVQAQEIIIEPAQPRVGDNVRVGVLLNNPNGSCLSLPATNTSQGVTHWLSQATPDTSVLYVVANINAGTNCPTYARYYYDLGQLNQGQHSLLFNYFPPSVTFQAGNFDPPPPYISMNFEVLGAPRVIASSSAISLVLLAFLLFLIVAKRLNSRYTY